MTDAKWEALEAVLHPTDYATVREAFPEESQPRVDEVLAKAEEAYGHRHGVSWTFSF